MYTGTYRIYRSQGTPEPLYSSISGDLTDGVVFGDGFHTITTIRASAVEPEVLYVGTTDGNVWRSLDVDASFPAWEQINAGLPDRYVTDVEASFVGHLTHDLFIFVGVEGFIITSGDQCKFG